MDSIFKPSKNCARLARAERAAFIIDGEDYFRAVRRAMRKARRCIFIVGWDLHSELQLVRNGVDDGLPTMLGKFLDALVTERPHLHVYLLCWDFSMIYSLRPL